MQQAAPRSADTFTKRRCAAGKRPHHAARATLARASQYSPPPAYRRVWFRSKAVWAARNRELG